MKKLSLLFVLFLFVSGYSQKRLRVYNYTGQTIKIYNVHTKAISGPATTKCFGYSVGLAPGDELVLENNSSTTKFPFYSPVTTPSIINNLSWSRITGGITVSNISGPTLYASTSATTQDFDYVDFAINTITGSAHGQIGVSTVDGFLDFPTAGYIVYYSRYTISPTEYEDWISFDLL